MAVNTRIYDNQFFENTLKFELPSSQAVVSILLSHFGVKSVVDIGCGSGIYLREFQNAGLEVVGFDGSPAACEKSLVGDLVHIHDLTLPLTLDRKYDLCLCVEVAEHIEPEYADVLVQSVAAASDLIVFTAAIPGQGPESIGHINEQPHEYWIKKFEAMGFVYQIALVEQIKKEMETKNVVWWISQNLMIFKHE